MPRNQRQTPQPRLNMIIPLHDGSKATSCAELQKAASAAVREAEARVGEQCIFIIFQL